jgi:hypothetical protein
MGFSRFEKYTPIKYNDVPMFTPNFKKIEENMLMAQKQIDDFDATSTAAIASIKSANGHSEVRDELVSKLGEDKDRIIQAYLSNPLEGGKLLKNFKNDISKDASSGLIYNLSLGYQDEQAKANSIKDYYKDPAVRDMELSKLYSKYTPDALFAGDGKYNPASDYKQRTFLNEKERNDRWKSFRDEAEADSWEKYVQKNQPLIKSGAYTLESIKEKWKKLELPKLLEMATLSFMGSPEMKSTYDMLGEAYYGVEGQGNLNYEEVPLVYPQDTPKIDNKGKILKDGNGDELYHKAGEPILDENGNPKTMKKLKPDTLAAKALIGSAEEKVSSGHSYEREVTSMDATKLADEYEYKSKLSQQEAAQKLAGEKELAAYNYNLTQQSNSSPSDVTTFTGDITLEGYTIERSPKMVSDDLDNYATEILAVENEIKDLQNNSNYPSSAKAAILDRKNQKLKDLNTKLLNTQDELKKMNYASRADDNMNGFRKAFTFTENWSAGIFGGDIEGSREEMPNFLKSQTRQVILKESLKVANDENSFVNSWKKHLGKEWKPEMEEQLRQGYKGAKLEERKGFVKNGVPNRTSFTDTEMGISGLKGLNPFAFKSKTLSVNGEETFSDENSVWVDNEGNQVDEKDLDIDVFTSIGKGGNYTVKVHNLKTGKISKIDVNPEKAPATYNMIESSVNKAITGYTTKTETKSGENSKGSSYSEKTTYIEPSTKALDWKKSALVKQNNLDIDKLNIPDKTSQEKLDFSSMKDFANLVGVNSKDLTNPEDRLKIIATRDYSNKNTFATYTLINPKTGQSAIFSGENLPEALKEIISKPATVASLFNTPQ